MSDDLDAPASDEEQEPNDNIRQLREQAKRARELEKKTSQLERELAFAKAGLDINDPKLKYFNAGYDGPLEVDAIKAEAEKAGFLQKPPEPDPIPKEQVEAMTALAAGGGAGAPPDQPDIHDELVAKVRAGEITDEHGIAQFLAEHGQPVQYGSFYKGDDSLYPWTQIR